jgi:hypothetical protein
MTASVPTWLKKALACRGPSTHDGTEEHVGLLKQGVVVWNKWREENPDIRLDLIGADLNRADRYNFAET